MAVAAVQVCEHLQRVGKVCGVWVVPIVGGISPLKQQRFLKRLPEVNFSFELLAFCEDKLRCAVLP